MHKFRELIIWQKSRELVRNVYHITLKFPKEEMYSLTSQIRRCAISIPSNIAEGSGRKTIDDFSRFLDIANGSAFELETQLILASDLNYLNSDELDSIIKDVHEIEKMIYSFKKKLN